jgi:hypothetical protein
MGIELVGTRLDLLLKLSLNVEVRFEFKPVDIYIG